MCIKKSCVWFVVGCFFVFVCCFLGRVVLWGIWDIGFDVFLGGVGGIWFLMNLVW